MKYLSPREERIISLFNEGFTALEIAERLNLSRGHIARILQTNCFDYPQRSAYNRRIFLRYRNGVRPWFSEKCVACGKTFKFYKINKRYPHIFCTQRCYLSHSPENKRKYYREKMRRYYKTTKGRVKIQEACKMSAIKNPHKVTARARINYAIKHNIIKKPPVCSVCGVGGRIEGHHPDYSKPLEVIWCCTPCHHSLHKSAKMV